MSSSRRQDTADAGWGIGLLVTVVVVIALLGVAFWGFRVLTAEAKGKGDARITTESGVNRLGQQAYFESTYADFEAQKAVIATAKSSLDAGTLDPRTAQTNLTGAVQQCINIVGDYNAAARTERAQDFRAADLPEKLDNSDCQEAAA